MTAPKISIIIPLYNKENSIIQVIDSVLNQTFKDFEVIVIDDGSTDDSFSIVSRIRDERIRFFQKSNGGVSSARNYGLKYCNSEYVFYLDADDKLENFALSILWELVLKFPDCDIFTANFKQVYPNIKQKCYCRGEKQYVVQNNYKDFYLQKFYLRTGICIIKKEVLLQSRGFNENIAIGEDVDLFLRLLDFCQIVYCPVCIFHYIKGSCELSKNRILPAQTRYAYIDLNSTKEYKNRFNLESISLDLFHSIVRRDFEIASYLFHLFRSNIIRILLIMPISVYKGSVNSQLIERLISRLRR